VVNHHRIWSEQRLVKAISPRGALASGERWLCSPRDEVEWGKSPSPPSEGGEVRGAREHQVEGGRVSISVDGNTPPSPATTTSPVLPPQAEGETRVAVQLEIRSQVAKKGHRSRKKAESLRGRFYGP
jgi:hypothetical protein